MGIKDKKSRYVPIRLEEDLYEQILEEAEENFASSISAYIRTILRKRKSRIPSKGTSKDIQEINENFQTLMEQYEQMSIDCGKVISGLRNLPRRIDEEEIVSAQTTLMETNKKILEFKKFLESKCK